MARSGPVSVMAPQFLRKLFPGRWGPCRRWRQRRLRAQIGDSVSLRVIVGAGGLIVPGWLATDLDVLDITRSDDWNALFEPCSIQWLLAEHVLEHLSWEENQKALELCWQYLGVGGRFRIAVPDGYRCDPDYVAEVKPPRDGHRLLFNVDTLSQLLLQARFRPQPVEYFDKQGRFHEEPWDDEDGKIWRSRRHDRQTAFALGDLFYTSLIVDAFKD